MMMEDICVQEANSDGENHYLLSVDVGRAKNNDPQRLPLYTQANIEKWYEDPSTLFTLNYLCQQETYKKILPDKEHVYHGNKWPLFPRSEKK